MVNVSNPEWRKLLEITKLQCAAIPFIPERERAEQLCDELLADITLESSSDSDQIYLKELRGELHQISRMSMQDIALKYGEEGWKLFLLRYLEATA